MLNSLHRFHRAALARGLVLCASFCAISPALATAQQLSPDLLHGMSWRLIGPFRGGRVTAVAGISGDSKTYYMGTPGGGVWKTINGGATWFPIFDEAHVASIGDLVVAPSDSKVIYVATGEQIDGNGVWKSTDAGATWSNVGIRDSRLIPSILVDPHDAATVYVAAAGDMAPSDSRGIFKSTDGGKTWRKVYFKDDRNSPTELDFDPADSRVIYAVVRQVPPAPGQKPVEGADSVIIRSTDAGETWSPVSDKGLPREHRRRIGLAIAPELSGKRIFALVSQGLFRSDDRGETWRQITRDPRILGSNYFGRVYCDPRNPDVVYVMQTSTYRSSDGGQTFVAWKGTPSGEDDHVLWIAPEDPSRILMGTDQGATITLDGGASWSSWFNQPTGQFYRVSTDRSFPYNLYAAQQDCGSVVVPSRSDFGLITYRDWFSSGSFESSFIAPDPLNSNFVYSLGWYGNVVRLDRATGQIATLFVSPAHYRASWETPIIFSQRDPHVLFYGAQFLLKSPDEGRTWKEISPDLTSKTAEPAPPVKAPATGHLPAKDDGESSDPFGDSDDESDPQAAGRATIQSIAPSPVDTNLIWVGTSSGLVQVTHDGSSWSNVTPSGLPEHATINSIEASPYDLNLAFAAAFVRERGNVTATVANRRPYFFRTRDGGKSWEAIVTGLPEAGIARVIREDPVRKGLLFAGTETGVYVSFDSGDHWQSLQLNLPASSVRDLTIHGADLVAATFGRGLFILDDISPLRAVTPELLRAPAYFLPPQTAVRAHWDNHPDTPLQPGTPAAQNPPDGAILYYYFNTVPKGEVTLDVIDEKGIRIRRFSSKPEKESLPPANVPEFWFYPPVSLPTSVGLNRFVWDLRYPAPAALPYGFFGERLEYTEYTLPDHAVPGETPRLQPPGLVVPPGSYELVLTVEGKTYHQKLQVDADPRVHASTADFTAQFELSRKISALMEASASSFQTLATLQKQVDERKKSLSGNIPKELSDALEDDAKQINSLESGTGDQPGFGPLNRDLGRYLVMIQAADVAPTESAHAAFAAACGSYNKNIAALNKLTSESIAGLNRLLAVQSLSPVPSDGEPSQTFSCVP